VTSQDAPDAATRSRSRLRPIVWTLLALVLLAAVAIFGLSRVTSLIAGDSGEITEQTENTLAAVNLLRSRSSKGVRHFTPGEIAGFYYSTLQRLTSRATFAEARETPVEREEGLLVTTSEEPATIRSQPGWTIRDEFAAMAGRVPGGFGGIYFDDGVLTIVLVDAANAGQARAALAQERLIEQRRGGPSGHQFDPSQAVIKLATYDYDQLYHWYQELLRSLSTTLPASSISVPQNRIAIGVVSAEQGEEVWEIAKELGIPMSALAVEIAPPVYRASSSLRSETRPVPGGLQIEFKTTDGVFDCTLGPNIRRLGQDGFLVRHWQHLHLSSGVTD
jgi:hypothetical protein